MIGMEGVSWFAILISDHTALRAGLSFVLGIHVEQSCSATYNAKQ